MAFRKSASSGKISSPVEYGSKGLDKKPGASFRKSSKSGSVGSPVEYGSKGMPSGIKVVHNRPAILD